MGVNFESSPPMGVNMRGEHQKGDAGNPGNERIGLNVGSYCKCELRNRGRRSSGSEVHPPKFTPIFMQKVLD